MDYDAVVVGGGILGVSISYYLGFLNPGARIAVVEREGGVGLHASGRNTGKVHAPYLYDPDKKGTFARAALAGYSMWEEYAARRGLPFKRDGVIEVATKPEHMGTLEKYRRWGLRNGLEESDMDMLDPGQLRDVEPEVRCHGALVCRRDAAVDYRAFTESLKSDAEKAGVAFLLGSEATSVKPAADGAVVAVNRKRELRAGFLVNAAGGQAVDVAHQMGAARELTDVHFRGEYWRAPPEYGSLTGASVYQVPKYSEYPFLDPHWIRRVDGTCEVGPNAVPVFSPYGYDAAENARRLVPKILEMWGSGARKALADPRFQAMAAGEVRSAVSRRAMIERVRLFLPRLDPGRFRIRGTAGIRSAVIDGNGSFVPDVVVREGPNSIHILNYNSPGATGALPFAAHTVAAMHSDGLFRNRLVDARCGPWRFCDIVDAMG